MHMSAGLYTHAYRFVNVRERYIITKCITDNNMSSKNGDHDSTQYCYHFNGFQQQLLFSAPDKKGKKV